MFKSVRIQGFRCFRDLSLNDLVSVNLVLGENNVGKTALLEAIFLHLAAHNPDAALKVDALRGLELVPLDPTETWGWLFRDKDTGRVIRIDSELRTGATRGLEIEFGPAGIAPYAGAEGAAGQGNGRGSLETATRTLSLHFRYLEGGQPVLRTAASMTPAGLQLQAGIAAPFPTSVFLPVRHTSGDEDVRRFSQLEERGEDAAVVELLRIAEPRLHRLSVGTRGANSVLRADIGVGRLVPIALLGEGFKRLVSMSLALSFAREGCLLLDEFENGVHYSRLAGVWKSLLEMARKTKTQIFATTHSRECVLAAHEASEGRPDELAVYRLERADADVRPVRIAHAELATALELGWEVR